jgi:hypothetical protein
LLFKLLFKYYSIICKNKFSAATHRVSYSFLIYTAVL